MTMYNSLMHSNLYANEQINAAQINSAGQFGWIAIVFLFAVLAIPPALIHDRRRRRKFKDTRPFRWGYYNIYSEALGCVLLGVVSIVAALRAPDNLWPFVIPLNIASIALLYFAFRRSRTAFIIITILTFNPILRVINGCYLHRRWKEMKDEYIARRTRLPQQEGGSLTSA